MSGCLAQRDGHGERAPATANCHRHETQTPPPTEAVWLRWQLSVHSAQGSTHSPLERLVSMRFADRPGSQDATVNRDTLVADGQRTCRPPHERAPAQRPHHACERRSSLPTTRAGARRALRSARRNQPHRAAEPAPIGGSRSRRSHEPLPRQAVVITRPRACPPDGCGRQAEYC